MIGPQILSVPSGYPEYQEKLVAFFDIVGWKNRIEWAGDDPERLFRLRLILRLFGLFSGGSDVTPVDETAQMSSFSDSVVVSRSADPDFLPHFLRGLGSLQVGCATLGFFVRGGVTVGKIIHEPEAVFGPALNRAYELESKKAKVPRIVFDPEIAMFQGDLAHVVEEDDVRFLDPFTEDFIQNAHLADPKALMRFAVANGLENLDLRTGAPHPRMLLMAVAAEISHHLVEPLTDYDWSKGAWVFDRLAARLGMRERASGLARTVLPPS